ncbi:uncharacterized protein V1510DRAFT_421851 [Dipodascopsis tothii]|uniref:uncharacterized protein n=1 Tax=Dipodascopsis tothii TaxID=44089 RepID=UPI0034CF847A
MSRLPVLISGAGISGPALAQGLKKRGIPFRLFERDSDITTRAQGYRLRITDRGAAAIKECVPDDLFKKFESTCADMGVGPPKCLNALTGLPDTPWPLMNNRGRGRPYAADRSELRQVLLTGLESKVEFDKAVIGFSSSPQGVRVEFQDGSFAEGSALVAADGVHSAISNLGLANRVPLDTQGRSIFGKIPLSERFLESHPHFSKRSMAIIRDTTQGSPVSLLTESMIFQSHPEHESDIPGNYLFWVLTFNNGDFEVPDETFLKMTPSDCINLVHKITAKWDTSFNSFFTHGDTLQASLFRLLTARPNIATWEASLVTYMGDSVHPMAPTAGIGANTALRDAAVLANCLNEGVSVRSIKDYEEKMRHYASEAIRTSQIGGEYVFGMQSFDNLLHATM